MNANSAHTSANGMAISEYDTWKKTPTIATQEWVASLPISQETPNSPKEENFSLDNERTATNTEIPSVSLVSRKIGMQGLYHYGKQNAADIYQLAIATRKARERPPLGDHGYYNGNTINPGEIKNQDRAFMLRSAYAAQRNDQLNSSFQSETTAFSFDSSFDCYGNEEPDAENLLLLLGFGGPSQGFDRIPERFLQPSALRGVEIEQFFALQQELDEVAETGSLGYRGLSGPSTRRPSTIVARLMERMRDNLNDLRLHRTSSLSTEGPSLCNKNEKNDPLLFSEKTSEEEQFLSLPLESCTTSRKSSLANSRKSSLKSLKRQECIELDDDKIFPLPEIGRCEDEDATLLLTSLSVSPDSSGFHDLPQKYASQGFGLFTMLSTSKELVASPSICVSSPSIVFSGALESAQSDSSFCPTEVDPIISVLQLATEAYRVRLECFPVTASVALRQERSDCNHNQLIEEDDSVAVKDDIRQELAKTDHLLQCLHQSLSFARPANHTYDSSAIRTVLSDMLMLLQQQQRLHQQVMQPDGPRYLEPSRREPLLESSAIDSKHSLSTDTTSTLEDAAAGTNSSDASAEHPSPRLKPAELPFPDHSWLRGLERRLTSQLRRTVRHEIRKALCSRSKLRKP